MENDLVSVMMKAAAYGSYQLDKKYPDAAPSKQMAQLKQYASDTRNQHLRDGQLAADYFNDMYAQGMDQLDQSLNGETAGPSAEQLDIAGQHFINHPMIQQQLEQFESEYEQQQKDIAEGKYTVEDLIGQQYARAGTFDSKLPNEEATYLRGSNVQQQVEQEFAPVEENTNG